MKQLLTKDILERYHNDQVNEVEKAFVDQWILKGIDQDYDLSDEQLLADLIEIRMRLNLGGQKIVRFRIWPRIITAAAAAAAIVIGIYLFKSPDNSIGKETISAFGGDIPAGKNTATLTLASGKTIVLSGDKSGLKISDLNLTYNDGSKIETGTANSSAEIRTLRTPNGGQYNIELPDGSKVSLNAASTLRFPSSFSGTAARKVSLTGEAFFDIAKSYIDSAGHRTRRAFLVETATQTVHVLGTQFNINSYPDEKTTKTTLVEGSVRLVSSANGQANVATLSPGQQAAVSGNNIIIRNANLATDLAWKNGDFVFDHEDFESILRKIEKWYDVQFIYEKNKYTELNLSGRVSRSNPISSVLFALQEASSLKFKIEGRRVKII